MDNVGGIEYTITANVDPLLSANKQTDASLDTVENAFDSAAAGSKRFDTQMTSTARKVKTAGAGMGVMRGQAQNLGYQLQDVAVQAQMGTNALTILGQQGSQFLGGFGGVGAIAGAFLAIGAAIGGVIQKTMSAESATKDYKTELDLLQQTVKVTDDGLVVMSDGFSKLAETNADVAMSKLKVQLDQVKSVMGAVTGDAEGLVSPFKISSEEISKMRGEIEGFKGTNDELLASIGKYDESSGVSVFDFRKQSVELADTSDNISRLSSSLSISRSDALKLGVALTNLETPDGVIEMSNIINNLAKDSDFSNNSINKLNVSFGELAEKSGNLKVSQEGLEKVINDIGSASESSEKSIIANVEANLSAEQSAIDLANKIQVQKIAMEEGEEAAIRLSVAQQLGNLVSDEAKQKVSDLAVEYYQLTKA